MTGWRSGEALTLQWEHVDLDRRTARLPDTKTGLTVRPLSQSACRVEVVLAVIRRLVRDGLFEAGVQVPVGAGSATCAASAVKLTMPTPR